jgi:tRNA-2-methylthio-N6-dimethylallyladenosine synthase
MSKIDILPRVSAATLDMGKGCEAATQKSETPQRKLFVKSFGCQMNVYDAQRMADTLRPEGYDETNDLSAADVLILNTCHIRERASEKVFSELGKLRVLKEARRRTGKATKIIVAGCVAQAEGAEILRRQRAVDLVLGPQNIHQLPELLRQTEIKSGIIATNLPIEDKFDHLAAPSFAQIQARGVSAFVTVQEGCDKFCSFCVVPYTRGIEISRPVEQIVSEVERLAAAGVREVTLLGQNVNGYHGQDAKGQTASLAELAYRLASIKGVERIRYTTSHPNDMNEDLIDAHKNLAQLMPFLHLPVQSGSDKILAAMNRKHKAKDYLDLIDKIRAVRPDIALSSDFITGFPGESEEDFQATLDLVETVGFASAYSFKYSPRPGTPGADFSDQIAEAIKSERLGRLQIQLDAQRHTFNESMIGQVTEILFEKPGRHPGQLTGKTPYLQTVQVEVDRLKLASMIGVRMLVKITAAGANSLFGELIGEACGERGPL